MFKSLNTVLAVAAVLLIQPVTGDLWASSSRQEPIRFSSSQDWPTGVTFGNGLAGVQVCSSAALTVLNYTVGNTSNMGILSHYWSTGNDGTDNMIVSYFVDGETAPSIRFTPAQAAGQGFVNLQSNVGNDGIFAAGRKMGKNALVGGWYHYFPVPFARSIVVQAEASSGCVTAYINVRGREQRASADVVVSPTLRLPPSARLRLLSTAGIFPPLSFVTLANISAGFTGVIYYTTFTSSTSPAGNNYIEGCFHFYSSATQAFPGLIVGTGVEDYFDSAYWFSWAFGGQARFFQHAGAGLMAFNQSNNVEVLSAYRFFDDEVLGFVDGGALQWRVGDVAGKCTDGSSTHPIGKPAAVNLASHVWAYVWPNGRPIPPPPPPSPPPSPPSPPSPSASGCSDGSCDGFCQLPNVRGCQASWLGSANLRAAKSGQPCVSGMCRVPADACGEGWAVCLSDFGVSGLDLASFRQQLNASVCAQAPLPFVAAMQHAVQPCPSVPVSQDNGCSASGWGSEPVCCGAQCQLPSCPNSVWLNATRIHIGTDDGCGAFTSGWAAGVLCCRILG